MIKLTFCVRRKPEITEEQFHDYWLNKHGPLVKSIAKDLKIHRYVQTHAFDTPLNEFARDARGAPERLDGIAELWWNSADDLIAAGATSEGQAAAKKLLEDEAKFLDFSRSPLWFNQEHVIVDGPIGS
jgi:uncharacterized protein (TIGR02118 family)